MCRAIPRRALAALSSRLTREHHRDTYERGATTSRRSVHSPHYSTDASIDPSLRLALSTSRVGRRPPWTRRPAAAGPRDARGIGRAGPGAPRGHHASICPFIRTGTVQSCLASGKATSKLEAVSPCTAIHMYIIKPQCTHNKGTLQLT